MSHIRQEYLDMAYRALAHVNLQGKVCNHDRFYKAAFNLFSAEIQSRPVLSEYLGRALRELPKTRLDVERLATNAYTIRNLYKFCEQDWLRERARRMGSNGTVIA